MSNDRRFNKRLSAPDYRIKRGAVNKQDGLGVRRVATATWDWEGTDSSGASNATAAAHGSGVYLPDNALVLQAWYEVIETFTSSGDDATIALHVQGANDIVTAEAISAQAAGTWDAGIHSTKVLVTLTSAGAATLIKLTAERELILTVGDHTLTAGGLVLFVEYVLSD